MGAGGRTASSSSYTAETATGQVASGTSTSSSYRFGSGFIYTTDTSNPPLPVELVAFQGRADGQAVRLTWQTASESKNAGFEVQRKGANSGGWIKAGYVESKASVGTTTQRQIYKYTVPDLPVGRHQFRLRQVDLDGSSTLHGPISVNVKMQEPVKLVAPSPNPVASKATLSFAVKKQSETTVALYNALGQQVATLYQGTPPAEELHTTQINVDDLPSGTYFVRLRVGRTTATQRMTVVR